MHQISSLQSRLFAREEAEGSRQHDADGVNEFDLEGVAALSPAKAGAESLGNVIPGLRSLRSVKSREDSCFHCPHICLSMPSQYRALSFFKPLRVDHEIKRSLSKGNPRHRL